MKQLASLDMLDMRDGAVVVPATLNGTQQKLRINTAGMISGITGDAVSALGLHPQRISAGSIQYNAYGQRLDEYVMISQLGLGDIRGSNLWFLQLPRGPGGNSESTVAGSLGADILRNYDVDFDFGTGKLKLFSPDHCQGRVVYWANSFVVVPFSLTMGAHIVIPVTLDGQNLDAVVYTGAPVTLLSQARAARLFNVGPDTLAIEKVPPSRTGNFVQYRYRFKSLSFEGVMVANPLIYLMPDAAEHSMTVDEGKLANDPSIGRIMDVGRFILGLDVLSKLHLYVAYREQKLYLTAAGSAGAAHPQGAPAP